MTERNNWWKFICIFILLYCLIISAVVASEVKVAVRDDDDKFPLPFTRRLAIGDEGNDVHILQELLKRAPCFPSDLAFIDGVYDFFTARVVGVYQSVYTREHLRVTGEMDVATARSLLKKFLFDGYRPMYCRGFAASRSLPDPFKYIVDVPIYENRDVETIATLYDRNCTALLDFKVRTKGQNERNELSSNGNTPTGLSTFDLNTPEPDPKSYGPYNVNRAVSGIYGNAYVVIPEIRNGILLHTGEWDDWNTTKPMPNSHGCIHAWPRDVKLISDLLTEKLGVEVRENTLGELPYPYPPQGLLSVWRIDPPTTTTTTAAAARFSAEQCSKIFHSVKELITTAQKM